jgi:hypothetical protein
MILPEKAADRLGDEDNLFERQLRVNRKGKDLLGRLFALRQISLAITQTIIDLLPVKRHRVIDHRSNPLLLEVGLQGIALRDTDGELMINVPSPGIVLGSVDGGLLQVLTVQFSHPLPSFNPGI